MDTTDLYSQSAVSESVTCSGKSWVNEKEEEEKDIRAKELSTLRLGTCNSVLVISSASTTQRYQ